jgi:DNA primase
MEKGQFVAMSQLSQGIKICELGKFMIMLELAMQVGLNPKKVSSTKGGEYHSSCPGCGGKDRFRIQTAIGRYVCRQCECKGDAIQFCRDFLQMSFHEACQRVGGGNVEFPHISRPVWHPPAVRPLCASWIEKAGEFVETSHQRLLIDSMQMKKMQEERGLKEETIRTYRVGWNPVNQFPRLSEWGLEETKKSQKMCLPKGIVIPSFDFLANEARTPNKIKIRRADWYEGDKYQKYHEVSGGSRAFSFYGLRTNQTALIVEAELDAMLLVQGIGDFCTCIALGGASKEPDMATAEWLKARKLILYSLDCDETGRKRYDYWRSNFPNLRAWPADSNKSPADSFVKDGINLKEWFFAGISYWLQSMPDAKD